MLDDYEPTVEITNEGMPQVRLWQGKPVVRFQVWCKPAGADCNIDCSYCSYLSRKELLQQDPHPVMSDSVLEEYVKQNIFEQNYKKVVFLWHGGEPTLCGLDFFKKAVGFQKKYKPDYIKIENDLQTNGLLLDDEWCLFLKENDFMVSLSVDGPQLLHDHYRTDREGRGTFDRVVEAAKLLKKHGVKYKTLTIINRVTAKEPLKVYRFLRDEIGSTVMQFFPVVEPFGFEKQPPPGIKPENMPPIDSNGARPGNDESVVTDWSVDPDEFGSFLCSVFDEWYSHDIGKVFVYHIESVFYTASGMKSPMCILGPLCGRGMALEYDGSLYSCDHYVYPEYKLGNIMEKPICAQLFSKEQHKFGYGKIRDLTSECKDCRYLDWCYGECLKNRFILSPTGEPGHNYLCRGYKKFFGYTEERVRTLLRESEKRR
jgi:uncharacterized protein